MGCGLSKNNAVAVVEPTDKAPREKPEASLQAEDVTEVSEVPAEKKSQENSRAPSPTIIEVGAKPGAHAEALSVTRQLPMLTRVNSKTLGNKVSPLGLDSDSIDSAVGVIDDYAKGKKIAVRTSEVGEVDTDKTKRETSASSKYSNGQDSGIGEDDATMLSESDMKELNNIITEHSDSTLQEAAAFRPPTPDLLITGARLAGSAKERPEMKENSNSLTSQKLPPVNLPKVNVPKGVAFDIFDNSGEVKLPTKLKKKKDRRDITLTQEEILAKQQAAELRRKEKEKELFLRLEARKQHATQVKQGLEKFMEQHNTLAEEYKKKMSVAEEKRRQNLDNVRRKAREVAESATKKKAIISAPSSAKAVDLKLIAKITDEKLNTPLLSNSLYKDVAPL
eukprot:Colp12_sorted_trinity150504_noHs@14537